MKSTITLLLAVAAYLLSMAHLKAQTAFTQITNGNIVTDLAKFAGPAWADFEDRGFLDLVIGNYGGTNLFYRNNGNGTFTKVTQGDPVQDAGDHTGPLVADFDNDGYADMLMVVGAKAVNPQTNQLYHNNGDGTFSPASGGALSSVSGFFNTGGCADYDNDGFLDLFVTRFPLNGTTNNLFYHNNGNTNAWIEVKLIGTVGNRSAIGAKVRALATIQGKSFWQLHEVTGGGARWSQPLVTHFGLGDATNVDTLRIEWPSGTVQEIHNVAARQILTITEPPRLLASTTNGVPRFSLKAWPGMQFAIQATTNLSAWIDIGAMTVTNLNGIVQIIGTNAPASATRFYRAVSQ